MTRTAADPRGRPLRALFVNSGMLGHRAVAALLEDAVAGDAGIEARHVDLSAPLGAGERALRWLLCASLSGAVGFGRLNLDLARWRREVHSGLVARRRIRAVEREWPPDVLHFHTQATAYCSLRRMTRTPSIVSIDITQPLASLEAPSALGRLTYRPGAWHDGAVFRRAAAITTTSIWAADDLARHYPACASKVRVMPYPVRLDLARPEWPAARAAREAASRSAPVRVLFMGGDFPRKGGPELMRAWRAADLGPRAVLTLATNWPIRHDEVPAGAHLARGITPYTDAWIDLWRETDLFVMPTRGEAFGMVFQEAAAAGVPAIGTAINAVPELIEDGVTGLLVPPGDVGALADALRRLVDSADARRVMGQAARARIERLGDPARYARLLTSLIHEVAAGGA